MAQKVSEALAAVRRIDDYDQIAGVYSKYAEAKVWRMLVDRRVDARPIPQQTGVRTPEFELHWRGIQ